MSIYRVNINEVMNLFDEVLPIIKSEIEVPSFNIVFNNIDKTYNNLSKNEIDETKQTIYVADTTMFFDYLTKIINSLIELREEYFEEVNPYILTKSLLKRIWLRMNNNDFNDIISFLQQQLMFIEDRTFIEYKSLKMINSFYNREVYAYNKINRTWDETDNSMSFYIKGEPNHELSDVFYGIRCENGEKVCYIYAVQNKSRKINKKIQRKLYHLNKGIDNPNVHPNQVYTLILFINECIKNGVTKIKIPKVQVLNHRYHEILSKKCERDFKNKWNYVSILETFENPIKKRQYENDKRLYSHFVDMENKIDQLKRNKLFLLVDRMKYYFDNIEFVFEDDNVKEYELRRKYE